MRFRSVYLLFALACFLFFGPILSDQPMKMRGFFGGRGNGLFPEHADRVIYHVGTLVFLLLVGWVSAMTFMRDYCSTHGRTSSGEYLFSLEEFSPYVVSGIKGTGITFFDIGLRPRDLSTERNIFDENPMKLNVSFEQKGKRVKNWMVRLGTKHDHEWWEFTVFDKGEWEAEIAVRWLKCISQPVRCELRVKAYSLGGETPILPLPSEAARDHGLEK